MFGVVYLPVHSSKLMHGFKFSEFPSNLSFSEYRGPFLERPGNLSGPKSNS